MNIEVKRWMEKEGVKFLRGMGVRNGQSLLDFGCGVGHYTIPASIAVGKNGRVYALDKDSGVLEKLRETARHYKISNIELINEKSSIPIGDKNIDVVLCYDILHYEEKAGRKKIYLESYRVLKGQGLFSVYPKHHRDDRPNNGLSAMGLYDIMKEIEESGFVLEYKLFKKLLHDDYLNEGYVLNFRRY